MHTVCLVASRSPALGAPLLATARRVTTELLPRLGGELAEAGAELPSVGGGWFALWPTAGAAAELVSQDDDGELLVLLFGAVYGAAAASAARVALTFRAGGAAAVRRLDGDFAALVVERAAGRVTAVTDGLGRRGLRWFADADTFVVSPHELCLAATGRCPITPDEVSACSAIAVEWSLGGRSLVRGIQSVRGGTVLRWTRGEVEVEDTPAFSVAERVDRRDVRGVGATVDRMVETVRNNLRLLVGTAEAVRSDVTAGMDSRAALAALISVVEPARVTGATSGGPTSAEVLTARRVARAAGVHLETLLPAPPTPDDFFAHLGALAFCMNGDTDGRRAIARLPRFEVRVPKVHGGGGGIYKGAHYRWRSDAARLTPVAARDLLFKKQRGRLGKYNWATPDLAAGVLERLEASVADCARVSAHGADHLDLFYLTERYGVWGAMASRFTWYHPMLSPYDSPELFRLALTLPPPLSNDCLLHRELVRRYLPGAYWEPVNHVAYLPLAGGQPWKRLANNALLVTEAGHYARMLLGGGARTQSHDRVRSKLLRELLGAGLAERLRAADGIARELAAPAELDRLLTAHASGEQNHLNTIGILAAMDAHLGMLRAARAAACRA